MKHRLGISGTTGRSALWGQWVPFYELFSKNGLKCINFYEGNFTKYIHISKNHHYWLQQLQLNKTFYLQQEALIILNKIPVLHTPPTWGRSSPTGQSIWENTTAKPSMQTYDKRNHEGRYERDTRNWTLVPESINTYSKKIIMGGPFHLHPLWAIRCL